MKYEESLKILGLQSGYTEEELKKAYKTLARKWHPDFFEQESEKKKQEAKEMMQQINEAYEFLSKNIGNNNSNRNYYSANSNTNNKESYFDVKAYAQTKYYELQKHIKLEIDISEDGLLENTFNNINRIITHFSLIYFRTIEEVDKEYEKAKQGIREEFEKLENGYFYTYCIFKIDIKEPINYNCTLKEFYEQLKCIREKYSQTILFANRLREETEKYKNYAGYEQLKNIIESEMLQATRKAKNTHYLSVSKILEEMHMNIELAFVKHFECLKRIGNLKMFFASRYQIPTLEEELKKKPYSAPDVAAKYNLPINEIIYYEQIVKYQFDYNKLSLEQMLNNVGKWEQIVETIKQEDERKAKLKENEELVNNLYIKIMKAAYDVLAALKINEDFSQIIEVQKTIAIVLEMFKKYQNGLIDFEKLQLLEHITFTNPSDDMLLFLMIDTSLKGQIKKYLNNGNIKNLDSEDIKNLDFEYDIYEKNNQKIL